MKIKCPICTKWMNYKEPGGLYNYHKKNRILTCNGYLKGKYHAFTARLNEYDNLYSTLNVGFSIDQYYFIGGVTIALNNNIIISLSCRQNNIYSNIFSINSYNFNDLCDKNVDILDYNEIYWFFKKEARRWVKLRAFL